MADIRCSHCGEVNPDFLDVCQFCQSPLKSESMVHTGEIPSEKDTGELEPILPDWLQDVRQQSRESAEDDSFGPETKPKAQNVEPLDLLAGLDSQDDSDEDEVPDWLASINPVEEKKSILSSASDEKEEPSDFFAQFSQNESQSSEPVTDETDQENAVSSMGEMEQQDANQPDELADWFSQASTESSEPFAFDQEGSESSKSEPVEAKEPEDLSWLHDLESSAKQMDEFASPQTDGGFDFGSTQSESSDEDLSWLDNLGGTPAPASEEPATAQPAESSEGDLGWLNDLGGAQTASAEETSASQPESSPEDLGWMKNLGAIDQPSVDEATTPMQPESSQDDLDWMKNLGAVDQPSVDEDTPLVQPKSSHDELSWMKNLSSDDQPLIADDSTPVTSESSQDDLDWMKNLGAVDQPSVDEDTPLVQPESSHDELSWMKNLSSDEQPSTAEDSTYVTSESSQDDLDWMKNLGSEQPSTMEDSASATSETSQDDLSWMKNLGVDDRSSETDEAAIPVQSESAQEDLSWLSDLAGTPSSSSEEPSPSQTEPSQDDLGWMKNLGEEEAGSGLESSTVEYTPRGTAPLNENAGRDSTPDWLKSAMEEPSMPAPGDLSMDWFTDQDESKGSDEISDLRTDETSVPTQSEPASVSRGLDLPLEDSSAVSPQDVDEMFNIDLPDWVSQETASAETSRSELGDSIDSADESLAPVELPSWVQAMRPVDSAIGDASSSDIEERVTESEGPLAGFSGVIPSAPIGSSLRPKAFSLKLQVTDEQHAGASLIEQIIASETAAHPSKATTVIASQRMLRWVLSGLFLAILTIVIGFGSQNFAVLAPAEVSELSNLVGSIPEGAPVLLVMDYEPAVAGELAAAAGPVLDQLALSRHSIFTFIAMSPNGSAMVEHLMLNTKVSRPAPDGLEYKAGEQYFNLGFLPGGSAGVLGFINDPVKTMPNMSPLINAVSFSDFEAVILMTDNADSGRVWVEQMEFSKQAHPEILSKPLVVISSAQAGPMLEPYVSSGQVNVMISGLSDAAKYEYVNQSRPGNARAYWDAFGIGLMVAVLSIVLGSLWNIFTGFRERRVEAEQG